RRLLCSDADTMVDLLGLLWDKYPCIVSGKPEPPRRRSAKPALLDCSLQPHAVGNIYAYSRIAWHLEQNSLRDCQNRPVERCRIWGHLPWLNYRTIECFSTPGRLESLSLAPVGPLSQPSASIRNLVGLPS